jgi:hypothetical protein
MMNELMVPNEISDELGALLVYTRAVTSDRRTLLEMSLKGSGVTKKSNERKNWNVAETLSVVNAETSLTVLLLSS